MNEMRGTFKCPKCGKGEVNGYLYWICRDEYVNNNLKRKFVFCQRKEEKRWKCCYCCDREKAEDYEAILLCCCKPENYRVKDKQCCYPCCGIIYLLFFFWVDLICYLCCQETTYTKAEGEVKGDNVTEKELFTNSLPGLTESEWNDKIKRWECNNCKFRQDTFNYFISTTLPNPNTAALQRQSTGNYVALQFISTDQTINYSILCKVTDSFDYAENLLYKEYPELKNKNCYFLANGNAIVKNKNIKENKINSGDKITIVFDENISTDFSCQ